MSHKHHKNHGAEDREAEQQAAGPGPRESGAAAPAGEGPAAAEKAAAEAHGAVAAAPNNEVEALRRQVAEQAELIAQLQRALAEMDNRRKRSERQMLDHTRYALQGVAVDILPVIDNFGRALKHAEQSHDFDALHDGLKLVYDQFLAILKQHHVRRIEALGRPFDPNHHEAMAEVESAEHPEHTVIEVDQEGYTLHDRTIRPSRVIVSKRPAGAKGGDGPAAPPADDVGEPQTH